MDFDGLGDADYMAAVACVDFWYRLGVDDGG